MKVILVLLCAVTAASTQNAPCVFNPCLNGGTCVDEGGRDFSCRCPLGFKGKLCDELACVDVNVTCERLALNGDCSTYSESMQRDCRKSCHFCGVCFSVECSVNRVCNEYANRERGYTCDCPEGMTGEHCDESLCYPPCQNGGVCKEDTLTCICPPGFNGTTCENCVDEDPNCPLWAAAGQCDSQARVRMTFCRHSCDNCPDTACTKKGEFCVTGAECTSHQHCQCAGNTQGDGRIFCANQGDRVCILHDQSQLQSFGGATANLDFPCRYRLSKFVTALQGTGEEGHHICSFEVFGFSLVSESGRYYPAAAEISLAIVDLASHRIKQKDLIKFDVDLGGIVSSEGHSVRWGSDTSGESWQNVTFNCVFNKDRFAIVSIPRCGFRLQFRAYDQAEDEAHNTPQSRLPAIVIAATPAAPQLQAGDTALHKFPESLCGQAGKTGHDDQLYTKTARHLKLETADEALLYSALDQHLPQASIVKGFTEAVLQDPSSCQEAGQFFKDCGNQTRKAAALTACQALLSRRHLLHCLGSLALETFSSCMDVFCNSNTQSCTTIRDSFWNAQPLSRKPCPFPAFLHKLCKDVLL